MFPTVLRSATRPLLIAGLVWSQPNVLTEPRPLAQPLAQPPAQAPRQVPARLDEGSFTIRVNGERIGREQFSIQRVNAPDGVTLEVRAEAAIGDRRLAVRLEADSAGTPIRYSAEERRGPELSWRLGGQRVRGRFATLSRGVEGEAAREYLLRPGAVVVEEDALILHALLVRGRNVAVGSGLTLPSLTPTANSQGVVRVVLEAEQDTIAVAGTRRPSRRWRVVTALGDPRLVWADRDGHLLRVVITGRGIDAVRDDVPR